MMRRWLPYIGIAAFYIALIIIVQIWIRPMFQVQLSARDTANRTFAALNDRVNYENDLLRRAVLRDSLQQVVPAIPGSFVSGLDSATGYVERVLQRELPPNPRAVVGVINVDPRYGTHPQVKDLYVQRTAIAGRRGALPFCVIAVPEHFGEQLRFMAQEISWNGLVGQCHFYARYGAPGPGIQKWMDQAGARYFARQRAARNFREIRLRDLSREEIARFRQQVPLRGLKCLRGQRDVCAESVASLEMTQTELEQFHPMTGVPRLMFGEGALLAKVEEDFGPERFERFWRSELPFQEAFEQTFDVQLGDWVYDWVQPLGHLRAGARLNAVSILLTLLLVGAVAGGALVAAQNRRI